jgi:hypothetical protein
MSFHYRIDDAHGLLLQKIVGAVQNASLLTELEQRLGSFPSLPELHLISDFADARTDQLTQEGIRAAVHVARLRRVEMAARGWLLVAPDDLTYAQARMFSMRIEILGIRARVCRSLQEALDELGVPLAAASCEPSDWSPPLPLESGDGEGASFIVAG